MQSYKVDFYLHLADEEIEVPRSRITVLSVATTPVLSSLPSQTPLKDF